MIICPECGERMTKLRKDGACKYCATPIVKVTVIEDGQEQEVYQQREKTEPREKTIRRFVDGNYEIEIDDENMSCYVTIKNTHVRGYLFCPKCNKKLFKNMTLRGSCEHKCDRCKYMNYHHFI